MKRNFIKNNIVLISNHVAEIQLHRGCDVVYKYNHYTEGAIVGSEHVFGISLNEFTLNFCGFYKFSNNETNCELYSNEENLVLVGFGSTYYLLDPKFLNEKIKFLHNLQYFYYVLKTSKSKLITRSLKIII